MGMNHCGKNKSEKRIWVEDFGLVFINTYLCEILCLCDDSWYMETFIYKNVPKIRFSSGYDYSVYLSYSTIESLLKLSEKYPGAMFYLEDSLDGIVANWQDGIEDKRQKLIME